MWLWNTKLPQHPRTQGVKTSRETRGSHLMNKSNKDSDHSFKITASLYLDFTSLFSLKKQLLLQLNNTVTSPSSPFRACPLLLDWGRVFGGAGERLWLEPVKRCSWWQGNRCWTSLHPELGVGWICEKSGCLRVRGFVSVFWSVTSGAVAEPGSAPWGKGTSPWGWHLKGGDKSPVARVQGWRGWAGERGLCDCPRTEMVAKKLLSYGDTQFGK